MTRHPRTAREPGARGRWRVRTAMPLRNERQAYWDDIDAHIASVALDGDAALERACPRAAADREAPGPASPRWRRCPRCVWRVAASSESRVLDAEADADARVERKASSRARGKDVRGRLENDRALANASAMRPKRARHEPPSRDSNPTASSRSPSRARTTAQTVTARSGAMGRRADVPLMGGGYTVVLERARRDAEEAEERRVDANVRALYFMPPSDAHARDGWDEDEETRGIRGIRTVARLRAPRSRSGMGRGRRRREAEPAAKYATARARRRRRERRERPAAARIECEHRSRRVIPRAVRGRGGKDGSSPRRAKRRVEVGSDRGTDRSYMIASAPSRRPRRRVDRREASYVEADVRLT